MYDWEGRGEGVQRRIRYGMRSRFGRVVLLLLTVSIYTTYYSYLDRIITSL